MPERKLPRNPSLHLSRNGLIQTKLDLIDGKCPNFCRKPTLEVVSCESEIVHFKRNVLEVERGVEPEPEII